MFSEVAYLRDRYPECRITVFTYDSRSTVVPEGFSVRYAPYFPSGLRKRPFANLKFLLDTVLAVRKSDLVVIGGGGIFYDNEGQSFRKQVFEWGFRAALVRFFRKPLLFWGVGIDVRKENVNALRALFSGPRTTVTVRDEKSAETLRLVGVASRIVPDPAFLMPPVSREDRGNRPKTVGISVRKGYLPNGESSVREIVRTVRKHGFSPVFVTHSFHPNDPETDDAAFVAEIAREEGIPVTGSLDETVAAYGRLDAMVAMRLHAGILSFVNGIPVFLLSYSKKTDAFARRVGLEWKIPASEFDPESFERRFSEFVAESEGPRFFALREKYGNITEDARISYEETFYGLERHQN